MSSPAVNNINFLINLSSVVKSAAFKDFVWKRGGVKAQKPWKYRYMVISQRKLYYYKSDKDSQPFGVIDLASYDKLEYQSYPKKKFARYSFLLHNCDGSSRPYIFAASSEEARKRWETEICKCFVPDTKPLSQSLEEEASLSVSSNGPATTITNTDAPQKQAKEKKKQLRASSMNDKTTTKKTEDPQKRFTVNDHTLEDSDEEKSTIQPKKKEKANDKENNSTEAVSDEEEVSTDNKKIDLKAPMDEDSDASTVEEDVSKDSAEPEAQTGEEPKSQRSNKSAEEKATDSAEDANDADGANDTSDAADDANDGDEGGEGDKGDEIAVASRPSIESGSGSIANSEMESRPSMDSDSTTTPRTEKKKKAGKKKKVVKKKSSVDLESQPKSLEKQVKERKTPRNSPKKKRREKNSPRKSPSKRKRDKKKNDTKDGTTEVESPSTSLSLPITPTKPFVPILASSDSSDKIIVDEEYAPIPAKKPKQQNGSTSENGDSTKKDNNSTSESSRSSWISGKRGKRKTICTALAVDKKNMTDLELFESGNFDDMSSVEETPSINKSKE